MNSDAVIIKYNANRFRIIAMQLYKTYKNHPKEFMGPQFFVNGAFAVELYLKAILSFTVGEYPKEHELHKLYELIPEDTRHALTDLYPEFRDFVKNESKAFENWRYYFETTYMCGHVVQMKKTLDVLHEFCKCISKKAGDKNE